MTVIGIAPKLSDAELLTLSVLQPLLGHTSEPRFVRYALLWGMETDVEVW